MDISKEGTTTFVTDSTVQEQVFNNTNEQTGIVPVRDQTISDFLAKPQLLGHVSWTTSQGQNVEIFSNSPEDALNTFDVYIQKIKGFNLVRGTAVLRYVLNAEPFHAGKLIASFIPVANQLASYKFRNLCLNQKTQQPCVEIDCRDAVGVMKIPYIAPTDYYEPKADTIGWGLATLSVLSPLATGSSGSNNVKVSIFIHFEDFELAAPIYPQGPTAPKMRPRPKRAVEVSIQDREAKIMETGTISAALLVASDVADRLLDIPVLSAFAEPASWVMRGLAHVASWFGWSKPNINPTQNVASRRLVPFMGNATGSTSAPKLALYHDNAVDVMPHMAGNGMDEMSFDFLKIRKAFCQRFTMTTSNPVDYNLYLTTVTPLTAREQITVVGSSKTITANSYAPFGYVSRHFRYWRGGLRMHVKIAKTDYHSGRIAVVYSPSTAGALSPPSNATASYSMREIIDIRGKSEFVLDLPYLINTPYVSLAETIGEVKIFVLNELRAPETVAQSIEFLVYWSACEDFEVEVSGSSVASPAAGAPTRTLPYFPQGGAQQADANQEVINEVVGNYPSPSFDLEPARTCMGEVFTSVKQLLNRYTAVCSSGDFTYPMGGFVTIYPFHMGGLYSNPTTGVVAPNIMFGDAISSFAPGYAFYRGGVRIHTSSATASTDGTPVSCAYNRNSNAAVSLITTTPADTPYLQYGDPFTFSTGDDVPLQVHDSLGHFESSIPYQNRTHMTIIDPYDQAGNNTPTGYSNPNTYYAFGCPNYGGVVFNLKRSASDEFQLAYFLGFPPVISTVVNS